MRPADNPWVLPKKREDQIPPSGITNRATLRGPMLSSTHLLQWTRPFEQLVEHRLGTRVNQFVRLEDFVLVDELHHVWDWNALRRCDELESRGLKLHRLHRAQASRHAAITDEAGRLVIPFDVDVVECVYQRRRRAVVVLRRHESKGVRAVDAFRPAFGVRVLVFLQAGMRWFVVDWQIEIGDVDQGRVEPSVSNRVFMEPFGDMKANSARTGAGDDRMQLEGHRFFPKGNARLTVRVAEPPPEPELGPPKCARANLSSRNRAIRHYRCSVQGLEIRDQVGALRVVLQAGVDHRRVGHHRRRIGEVFVEGGGVPDDSKLLMLGGVLEACNAAGQTADHAEQRRADAVHTWRYRVADAALRLENLLAGSRIGGEGGSSGSSEQQRGNLGAAHATAPPPFLDRHFN